MADYGRFQTLDVVVADKVATITLDVPEKGNAFDGVMHREFGEVLHDVGGDPDVNAILLTGAGDVFCGGGDPEFIRDLKPSDLDHVFLDGRRLLKNVLGVDQPIVVALNGDAVGVGATVAVFCDVILAADHAVISDPHVMFGIAAGDGGALMWALQLGITRAKYHLMTGEPIGAVQAAELGLVNEVMPAAELMPRARELAAHLASGPGPAIRGTKRIINKLVENLGAGVLDFGIEVERTSILSEDHREAVAAYFEQRPPVFHNR